MAECSALKGDGRVREGNPELCPNKGVFLDPKTGRWYCEGHAAGNPRIEKQVRKKMRE